MPGPAEGPSDPSGKAYPVEGVTVWFDQTRCRHFAECVAGLPDVFKPGRRPWVRPELGDASEVARVVLPVWTGYFVSMFKATSLLSIVAASELMGVADEIAFFNFRYLEVYGVTFVIYAVIGTVSVVAIRRLAQRWSVDSPRIRGGAVLEATARVA